MYYGAKCIWNFLYCSKILFLVLWWFAICTICVSICFPRQYWFWFTFPFLSSYITLLIILVVSPQNVLIFSHYMELHFITIYYMQSWLLLQNLHLWDFTDFAKTLHQYELARGRSCNFENAFSTSHLCLDHWKQANSIGKFVFHWVLAILFIFTLVLSLCLLGQFFLCKELELTAVCCHFTDQYCQKNCRPIFTGYIGYYGLPDVVHSDWYAKFTSLFWKSLFQMFGTKLAMTTVNKSYSNGQAKNAVHRKKGNLAIHIIAPLFMFKWTQR